MRGEASPVVDDPDKIVFSMCKNELKFKEEAKELLIFHMNTKGDQFKNIMLENW